MAAAFSTGLWLPNISTMEPDCTGFFGNGCQANDFDSSIAFQAASLLKTSVQHLSPEELSEAEKLVKDWKYPQ